MRGRAVLRPGSVATRNPATGRLLRSSIVPRDGQKYCYKCNSWKRIPDDFHKARDRADGFAPFCKGCSREICLTSSTRRRAEMGQVLAPYYERGCTSCG